MIAIVLPFALLGTGLIVVYRMSSKKSQKMKQIIWGLTLMGLVAPVFSWLIGGLYATFGSVETTGWAEIVYPILIFPVIFLSGLFSLIKGILKKKKQLD